MKICPFTKKECEGTWRVYDPACSVYDNDPCYDECECALYDKEHSQCAIITIAKRLKERKW